MPGAKGGNCSWNVSSDYDTWVHFSLGADGFDDTEYQCTVDSNTVCVFRSHFGRSPYVQSVGKGGGAIYYGIVLQDTDGLCYTST